MLNFILIFDIIYYRVFDINPEEVDLVLSFWPKAPGDDGSDGMSNEPSSSSYSSSASVNNNPPKSPTNKAFNRNYSTSTIKKKSKWYKTFFLSKWIISKKDIIAECLANFLNYSYENNYNNI